MRLLGAHAMRIHMRRHGYTLCIRERQFFVPSAMDDSGLETSIPVLELLKGSVSHVFVTTRLMEKDHALNVVFRNFFQISFL